jgi:VWFA-related protein
MRKVFLIFLLLLFSGMAALSQEDPLKYNITVDVKMLPLFAMDGDGNPVFDLAKEDLELYINGKPYEISYFKRFDFESSTVKTSKVEPEENMRVIFIILDTMFTSRTGFRRSKEIIVDLVGRARPGDRFVLFENSDLSGLRYVAGGEESRELLIKKVKKIRRPISRWATQLYRDRELSHNIDFSLLTEARLETKHWRSAQQLRLASERMRYRHHVKHFSNIMSRFKYILKTIDKPKLVFLISEGMAASAFKLEMRKAPEEVRVGASNVQQSASEVEARSETTEYQSVLLKDEKTAADLNDRYSSALFRYLGQVAKSVNFGGSVIYTINPRALNDINDDNLSGEMSLRYMAVESGGRYFSGSDADEIVKRIERSTSGYYQLAFYSDPKAGENLEIDVRCKREGVRVRTVNHAQGSKNYLELDEVQRKMFALNVVSGGSWSRTVGKVMRVRYSKKKGENPGKRNTYTLTVPLPKEMKNKKLDMFLINLDTRTNRVDMDIVSKDAKDWLNLKVVPRKHRKQYFVIIEPSEAYCIYNFVAAG